tara:strand:- start:179 stop:421 length:243 start_codon:yes stop_codon:yes gene_type:complete
MPRFSKTLKTRRGDLSLVAKYDNNYLTIYIAKHGVYEYDPTVEIFEGKISLKTELDESGEIILPDWIRVYSDRVESEYRQ